MRSCLITDPLHSQDALKTETSIDDDLGADGEGRFVGGQKDDRTGDLGGLTEAPGRDLPLQRF